MPTASYSRRAFGLRPVARAASPTNTTQLADLARAGFDLLNFMPAGDPWRQLERLARDVCHWSAS
jgi:hypothetical protein